MDVLHLIGPVNRYPPEAVDLLLPPIILQAGLVLSGNISQWSPIPNPGSVRLTIAGEVTPKPRSVEDDYRYEMGPMRLKSNHLAFGNIMNTQVTEKNLEVINTSKEAVNIEFVADSGSHQHLGHTCYPETWRNRIAGSKIQCPPKKRLGFCD